MAALAYRDDKILARKLLSHPFFCLTPAEPFFRPDRSSTAPSGRVAVKDGRAFRGPPKGLSLTAATSERLSPFVPDGVGGQVEAGEVDETSERLRPFVRDLVSPQVEASELVEALE